MCGIRRITQQLFNFLLVACLVSVLGYLLLCNQIGRLADISDKAEVTLAGRATDCRSMANGAGPGFYRLKDPTGETLVITRVGVPAEEALVVIRGTKHTKNGHIVVVETHRLVGTF